MASLTKIMTFLTVLMLSEKYFFDLEHQIKVSKYASKTPGTSANLKLGDSLSIKDLLYGLMLPSGNDAAIALSEFFGYFLHEKRCKNESH